MFKRFPDLFGCEGASSGRVHIHDEAVDVVIFSKFKDFGYQFRGYDAVAAVIGNLACGIEHGNVGAFAAAHLAAVGDFGILGCGYGFYVFYFVASGEVGDLTVEFVAVEESVDDFEVFICGGVFCKHKIIGPFVDIGNGDSAGVGDGGADVVPDVFEEELRLFASRVAHSVEEIRFDGAFVGADFHYLHVDSEFVKQSLVVKR